jgi:hypothetical protein
MSVSNASSAASTASAMAAAGRERPRSRRAARHCGARARSGKLPRAAAQGAGGSCAQAAPPAQPPLPTALRRAARLASLQPAPRTCAHPRAVDPPRWPRHEPPAQARAAVDCCGCVPRRGRAAARAARVRPARQQHSGGTQRGCAQPATWRVCSTAHAPLTRFTRHAQVEDADGTQLLVRMPQRFNKMLWVKRGAPQQQQRRRRSAAPLTRRTQGAT